MTTILSPCSKYKALHCKAWLLWIMILCGYGNLAWASEDSAHFVLVGFAAHPDDEDGATLAYYAKYYHQVKKPVKVYSVFFTRGEGGQNEIGSALYEELGSIRTRETLQATELIGAEAIFLDFKDFGFSKTAKETFAKWGSKDKVLQKVVYLIRKLRPDVVITNHDTITTLPRRQHGHHQAVGISLYEAFEKAADTTYCPEHFEQGAMPWQIKKLFVRAFRQNFSSEDSLFVIDTAVQEPSGKTVQELAARALSQHRSQGMDKLVQNATSFFFQPRRYALWRIAKGITHDHSDIFSGIAPQHHNLKAAREFAEQPKFLLFVSPQSIASRQATEREWQARQTPTYNCRFVVVMENPTKKILPVTLSITRNGRVIFRKEYVFNALQKERLADTIQLALEKIAPYEPLRIEQLTFEAVPIGAEAKESHLSASVQNVELKPIEAKVARAIRIGLIHTYDNTLEETLQALNVAFERLDSARLASQDLSRYTTILIDMRAGEYRRDLLAQSKKLFEFMEQGGHVVAFYNKPQDWNANRDKLAPYPIELTSERVVEEDAKVTVLNAKHHFFNKPNKIEPNDWLDWVQERSVYLPADDTTKTSVRYERLLAMSDENESQPPTSILTAKVGKGSYTYLSLALYRQLRTLHSGALKLFANLISQPRIK
jgi:LmbE family N-acetylglucosaminyl deacetylase